MTKNEDKIKTQPVDPRFDVILLDVMPHRRMNIVDILLKVDLEREKLSFQEALLLTFRLPSTLARAIKLSKAVELETVFEVYGATVELRPSSKLRQEKKKADDNNVKENGDVSE